MSGLTGTLFGSIGLLLWAAAFSGMLVVIVSESSEGHDRVYGWHPANFIESMPELFGMIVAATVTAGPGFAIGEMLMPETWQKALCTAASVWLVFPIVLLSQLAAASPWGMLNGQLIGAAIRRPFSTLLFYVESAGLLFIVLLPIAVFATVRPSLPVLFAPLYVAGLFVYGRLIGRWGWLLAEAVRVQEMEAP